MHGTGMGWGMGLFGWLFAAVLVLALLALVKYLTRE